MEGKNVGKREEFSDFMKESMKSKDTVGLATARLILAALKDRDIAARSKGQSEGIDEAEILSMLQTMVKQRKESLKTYAEAGREELAEREEAEIKVIERFLPKQMGDAEVSAEIEKLIAELNAESIRDMGKIMAALKERFAGQMDMGKAGGLVKAKLA